MTYATLLVHLQLGQANGRLLQIAGDLAERYDAEVIGVAVSQPIQRIYQEDYVIFGDVVEQRRAEIEKRIAAAEREFRASLQGHIRSLEWRSSAEISAIANYLAYEVRSADLLLTSIDRGGPPLDPLRHVNTGELVMQAGRPVLCVPAGTGELKLERAMVCWKDTREARRAAFDALPLLKSAAHVAIVEIASEDELSIARKHVEDVAGWLKRHGIVAETIASASTGDDASWLLAIAQDQDAGLIVAGAYGHSRVREMVLGGVTHEFLRRVDRCLLLSH